MTLGLAIPSIDAAIYARLATDSAGSAARASLGSSSSVAPLTGATVACFPIALLEAVRELRVPPIWAGFERGPISGRAGFAMRSLPFDWWLYDAPDYGAARLEALAQALDALYKRLDIAGGTASVDLITGPTPHITGMTVMRVRIVHTLL